LRARYDQAGSDAERRTYVQALGNTGDPRALPILERAMHGAMHGAMHDDDRGLASPAVFSLRFIAGTDADALLDAALAQPELALAAVRAIGYRDPARWRDRLVQVQAVYTDHAGIQDEIRGILRRWS
jgi:HEAT repeat protein